LGIPVMASIPYDINVLKSLAKTVPLLLLNQSQKEVRNIKN